MKVPPSGIGWSIQERGAAGTWSNKRKEWRKSFLPVRSDGKENRFAASDDQGMFVVSCQGVVRSANCPAIAIESDATGLGGDDGLDGDDETIRENVVSEGIGEVGNGG